MSDKLQPPEELAKKIFERCHCKQLQLREGLKCYFCRLVELIIQDRLSIRKRCAEVAKEVIDLNKFPDYEVPIWVYASDVIAKAIEEMEIL